jgi:hypothetical protein
VIDFLSDDTYLSSSHPDKEGRSSPAKSGALSIRCPDELAYVALLRATAHVFMTFVTDLQSRRWWSGIAPDKTPNVACRSYPLIWAMFTSAIPTGI